MLPEGVGPDRMKLFLHIGMDKTGTTFLQGFCHERRDRLARHGICYPFGVAPNEFSHVDFAHAHGAGWNDAATDEGSARAIEKLSGVNPDLPLLLSSEALSTVPNKLFVDRIKTWAERNGYDDAEVIVYLRNQVDLFVALYAEAIKWGRKEPADKFYDICKNRLVFSSLITGWKEAFGDAKVHVLNYDLAKADLIGSFFGLMNVENIAELTANYVPAFANYSPPLIILEYIRRLSIPIERIQLYEFIIGRFAHRKPASLKDLADAAVWPLPSRLMEDIPRYMADNEKVFADPSQQFEDLYAVADRYGRKLISLDERGLQEAATMLLFDMLPR